MKKITNWEKLVLKIADAMIKKGWTFFEIEEKMFVPHTTAHRYITTYLESIDADRYYKCIDVIEYHKHNHKKGRHCK